MPLSPETRDKVKKVFLRTYDDLPVAKDLPRLAKFIEICDESGVPLSYVESKILDLSPFKNETGGIISEVLIFVQIRRVLLTLCLALVGSDFCKKIDKLLLQQIGNENFLLPEVLGSFLAKHFGEDSKIIKVLKCCNQVCFFFNLFIKKKKNNKNYLIFFCFFFRFFCTIYKFKAAIAPAIIELKMTLGMENTTKDVAGTWRITVIIANDSYIRVLNTKREICIQNKFELEWQLTTSLQDNMERLKSISFRVKNGKKIGKIFHFLLKFKKR